MLTVCAVGRTDPYPRIHPKGPTASLVSKKVLASIIGQIFITSAFQFWAFFWVRTQPWYIPPPPNDPNAEGNQLESTNYENTVLFLISCFQYVLVAAVFSIGPPYRKPMWTNGRLMLVLEVYDADALRSVLLMLSIGVLVIFSTIVLLVPTRFLSALLGLVHLPMSARFTLLLSAVLNAVLSMGFERWGAGAVASVIGFASKLRKQRRTRDGKTYKAIESTQ